MIRSFRDALRDSLMALAETDSEFVVLNADSARVLNLDVFKATYPGRIFCYGISEADMLSAAAGLATTGITPIVVGFSMFVTEKPFEQIRQAICYPNLNVKIIATHGSRRNAKEVFPCRPMGSTGNRAMRGRLSSNRANGEAGWSLTRYQQSKTVL